MKKTVSILTMIFIFFIAVAPTNIYAHATYESIEGVKATISGCGTSEDTEKVQIKSVIKNDIIYSIKSNKYIMLKQSSIHDIGDGFVSIQASTKADGNVDKLGLRIHLEIWTDNSWSAVKSWSTDKYDTKNIDFKAVYSVKKGNIYRIRAMHTAYKGTISESDQTITSYITIK